MPVNFPDALDRATSLPGVFEIINVAAEQHVARTRGGLMLALADLGNHPRGFLGAFYVIASNVIVMNKVPLVRIRDTQPHLYNHYAFHVLLHEYLHALVSPRPWCPRTRRGSPRTSSSSSSRTSTAGTRATSRSAAARRDYNSIVSIKRHKYHTHNRGAGERVHGGGLGEESSWRRTRRVRPRRRGRRVRPRCEPGGRRTPRPPRPPATTRARG